MKPFENFIPETFRIAGMTYHVFFVDEQMGGTLYGSINHPKNEVALFRKLGENTISREQHLQTFWHEVVHGILTNMGESELNDNEKFVCTFSSFLNEVMQSAEIEGLSYEKSYLP